MRHGRTTTSRLVTHGVGVLTVLLLLVWAEFAYPSNRSNALPLLTALIVVVFFGIHLQTWRTQNANDLD
jgi:hypothetical protein